MRENHALYVLGVNNNSKINWVYFIIMSLRGSLLASQIFVQAYPEGPLCELQRPNFPIAASAPGIKEMEVTCLPQQ